MSDPRMLNTLSMIQRTQHQANRIAETANLLAYARLLTDRGIAVPEATLKAIELGIGDRDESLSSAGKDF